MFAVSVFDLNSKKSRIEFLEKELLNASVYSNIKLSTSYNIELKNLKYQIEEYEKLKEDLSFLEFGMQNVQESDSNAIAFVNSELDRLTKQINGLYVQTLLSDKYDKNNAIVKIHSGAGGTESCDWVQMLFRMYNMYAKLKGYQIEAVSRFLIWLRSFWQVTTIPVGMCVNLIALSVLLTCCPPAPELL